MSGCDWQNKSFSVAISDHKAKNICGKCHSAIKGVIYEAKGLKLCLKCFDEAVPSKEIGLTRIDAFNEVYDRDLGSSYSSIHEKQKLMKEKGITYAEDFKQNRDLGKEAEFKFGKQGNRKMGDSKWI